MKKMNRSQLSVVSILYFVLTPITDFVSKAKSKHTIRPASERMGSYRYKNMLSVAVALLLIAHTPAGKTDSSYAVDVDENTVVVEDLRQSIKRFTQKNYESLFPSALISVEINDRLDGLRNRECGEIVTLDAPRHLNRSGNILINVSCSFPQKWKAFVPASVDVSQEVVVAVGPIARDMPINASNTKTKRINLDSFRDQYITDLEQAKGMVARRTFRDGQIIRTDQITHPVLVKRGDKVLILADAGQTQVKMFGTALSAGKQGERIKVRNSSSSRVIFGQITQSGQVKVSL